MNEHALSEPVNPAFSALSEAENLRAVDLIETAGGKRPFCSCGAANTAVAHGDVIWLECRRLGEPRDGLRGLLARFSVGVGHTRRPIIELSRP